MPFNLINLLFLLVKGLKVRYFGQFLLDRLKLRTVKLDLFVKGKLKFMFYLCGKFCLFIHVSLNGQWSKEHRICFLVDLKLFFVDRREGYGFGG